MKNTHFPYKKFLPTVQTLLVLNPVPVIHPGGEDPSPAAAEGEAGRGGSSGTRSHHQVSERVAVPQHELGHPVHLHLHLLTDLQHHL